MQIRDPGKKRPPVGTGGQVWRVAKGLWARLYLIVVVSYSEKSYCAEMRNVRGSENEIVRP